MSKKANPTLIGGFVLGATALALAAWVMWSKGLGGQATTYRMFFDGSVQGLDVGAPVMFKGVHVGSVSDIRLQVDPDDAGLFVVPVTVEIDVSRFNLQQSNDHEPSRLAEQGLRAQLELESLVTGKLLIELGFFPDKPAVMRSTSGDGPPEIPTVRTALQELQEDLQNIDVTQMAAKASAALDSINRLLNTPDLYASLASLNRTLKQTEVLLGTLNTESQAISKNLTGAINDARLTLQQARATLDEMNKAIADGRLVLDESRVAVNQVTTTVKTADATLRKLDGLFSEDSPLVYRLDNALNDVSEAARSVSGLAQTLERQPEALLRGRD